MSAPEAQKSDETAGGMTPARSHLEIQKVLRDEIADLRATLDARLKEISALSEQLESAAPAPVSESDLLDQIEDMERRHALEITLLHVAHASAAHGPANGVAPFAQQLEILETTDLFDATWYLQAYPDVAGSGMSPKEHYVQAGAFEQRNPGPNFDTGDYYLANPDVASQGWPALVHYAAFGKAEGRPIR